MIVLIVGGFSVWVRGAKIWQLNKDTMEALGRANKVLATFRTEQVVGWFYDNQSVVTYGFRDRSDAPAA